MHNWYLYLNEKTYGPYDETKLQAIVKAGKITGETLMAPEGGSDWLPAAQISELSHLFAPAVSPTSLLQPEIRNDAGPFIWLGGEFDAGGGAWLGTAVASPHAVYLLKEERNYRRTIRGAGSMLVEGLSKDDDIRTCSAGELSAETQHKLGGRAGQDVIVIQKPSVSRVSAPLVDNYLNFRMGEQRVRVMTNLYFTNAKARGFLGSHGWPVNKTITPTMQVVHGHGVGRTGPPPPDYKSNPWVRVLLVLLGLAILAISAFFRFQRTRGR